MEFRQIAILVEGQTESAFVHEILAPYLQSFGVYVTPVIVKTSRLADGTTFKGGGMVWKRSATQDSSPTWFCMSSRLGLSRRRWDLVPFSVTFR